MELNEHRLPVISSKTREVSEPLHESVRPFSLHESVGMKKLLVKDYKAAGTIILEYQKRIIAAGPEGERIGLETHLVLEVPEFSRELESISHSGGALEASPARDDSAKTCVSDFTQRLAALNRKGARQLADMKETGRSMSTATEKVARAMTRMCQGLGEIKAELKPLKLSVESKS